MTHFQIWKELESKYRNIGTFIKILLAPQIFICCRHDLYHLKALFISFQMIPTISLAIQGAECEIDFKMKFWAEKKCGYFPIKMGHFLKLHTRAYYPRGHMWVKFQRNRPRSQHPTTTHPTPPTRTGPQNFTKYFRPHRFRCYATMLYNIRLIDDVWSISMQDGVLKEYQLWQNEKCHPHTPHHPPLTAPNPIPLHNSEYRHSRESFKSPRRACWHRTLIPQRCMGLIHRDTLPHISSNTWSGTPKSSQPDTWLEEFWDTPKIYFDTEASSYGWLRCGVMCILKLWGGMVTEVNLLTFGFYWPWMHLRSHDCPLWVLKVSRLPPLGA